MTLEEIEKAKGEFVQAAKNAIEAGLTELNYMLQMAIVRAIS
jgi:hypothetical protein